MSQPNLQNVIEVLPDKPDPLPGDYKIRQSGIREKLNTAMPVRIAEVVRDLGWRKVSAASPNLDVNLLDESRRLLAGEIAVINDVKFDNALQLIEQNVSVSIVLFGQLLLPKALDSLPPLHRSRSSDHHQCEVIEGRRSCLPLTH